MGKKRRGFTPEFKFRVVMEVLTGAKRPAEICREHQLADSVLSRWRQRFLERGAEIFIHNGHGGENRGRADRGAGASDRPADAGTGGGKKASD